MTNKTDLFLILGLGALVVFILWKSGIFKITNAASDLFESAGDLANTAISGANKVATDIFNLPENIATLAGYVPDVVETIGFKIEQATGWDLPDWIPHIEVAEPTERAKNIVNSLRAMYPDLATDRERVLASVRDNISYDERGFPIYP